jgi:5-methylcytosine-specific restriction endonuclease McrA
MSATDRQLWTAGYRRLRLAILARDGNACQIRGPSCTHIATQVDHIVARADGGDVYAPSNLRAACVACNGRLAAERTNAARYRNAVARYEIRL